MSTHRACHLGHQWEAATDANQPPHRCPVCGNAPVTSLLVPPDGQVPEDPRAHLYVLSSILETMGDGLVGVDENGTFLLFNRAAQRILGMGPSDVPVKDWPKHYGLYDPETEHLLEVHELPLARALQEEVTHEQEILVRNDERPDGVYISVTAHPLRGSQPEGEVPLRGGVAVFRDITESKRNASALQHTEERFRKLFNLSPDAVFVEDFTGKVLDVNTTGCRLHGMNRDQIVGRHFLELIPVGYRETAQKGFEKMVRGELNHVDGFCHNKSTGADIPVEIVASRIVYEGTPALLLHVRDITERKRDQEQLFKLFQAVEQTADAVFITDAEGKIEYANRGFEKQSGYQRDEVVGQTPRFLKSGEHQESLYKELWKTILTGEVYRGRLVNKTKDGRLFPCDLTISPILDVGGGLRHFVTTWKDDSERERHEAELEKSRERFRLAVNGSQEGIWDWDIRSDTVFFSPRWKGMLGYKDDEIQSNFEEWAKRIHPDEREHVLQTLSRYLSGEIPEYDLEHQLLHKDENYRWIRTRGVALFDEKGEAYRMAGSHTDITSRKKDEEALRQAMKDAEQANRAKNLFLAHISHEMRTPLHGVLGMTQIVLGTDLNEEQRECLQTVQSSARSLEVVIKDLLDFADIEAGELELLSNPFDLPRRIRGAIQIIEPVCKEKGLDLHIDLVPNLPRNVQGDWPRLQQVLLNLIGNAIKFTKKGSVRLKVTRIESPSKTDDRVYVCFEVTDTGIGIAVKDRERIFKPFVQQDGSMTRAEGGTGLGLSITSHIVEKMEGTLRLESQVGRGSTFHLTIPFALAPEGSVPSEDKRKPTGYTVPDPHHSLKLLVAEDCVVNRKVIKALLTRMGHEAILAEDGREAIAKYRQGSFDAIFMDVQMPNIDGLEATRRIRADEGTTTSPIPIIALTANARDEDRQLCMQTGMSEYLTKPLESAELEKVLRRLQVRTPSEPKAKEEAPVASESTPAISAESSEVFDEKEALQRVGGDVQLLQTLVNLFCEDLQVQIGYARESLAKNDVETFRRSAHTMKGASATVGASEVRAIAMILEDKAKANDLNEAEALVEQIDEASVRLRETITRRFQASTETSS